MKRRAWFAQLKPLLWLTIVTSAFLIEQSTHTLDIIVTSDDNSGIGTLRQAIEDINSGGGGTEPNNITFDPNVKKISLLTQLPSINNPVTINGFNAGMDCAQLSPANDPELFSDKITVTIDGSNLPNAGSANVIGILICANDVTVRGLRIANFSNIEDAQVAGIVSEGFSTLIECCEITNIYGNNFGLSETVVGIQGNADTIISNCFVHNLGTLNHTAIDSATSGSIYGITFFKTARGCRVEELKIGNIVYNHIGSDSNTAALTTGNCAGISNKTSINQPCAPPQKQCECPSDCQGSECILVENCVVNCCQSGSVFATTDANVMVGECSGIAIVSNKEIVIKDSTVCDISTGNTTLTEGTFSLTVPDTFGIVTTTEISSCTIGNTVHNINRGAVKIDGLNSTAELRTAVGLYSVATTIVAQNNSVSNVSCQHVTTTGICSTVQDGNLTNNSQCVGAFSSPLQDLPSICSGMILAGDEVRVCNNIVTNINLGKRTANGEEDLIVSGKSSGISVSFSAEAVVEENSVNSIFGAQLSAGFAARGIFGGSGSGGIILFPLSSDFTLTVQNNMIVQVCEQSLHATGNTQHDYGFLTKIEDKSAVLLPSTQTVGLLVSSQEAFNNNPTGMKIEGNTIKKIVGALIQSESFKAGTTAIGIAVKPPIPQRELFRNLQLCMDAQNALESSKIQSNTIQDVWGGTKNAAYGILLDGTHASLHLIENMDPSSPLLFDIHNNQISNIRGHGLPEQKTTAQLISLNGCGTQEQDLVTFARFPYQPTSGIYIIFGNCSTLFNNNINAVTDLKNNARGITTQASSDMEITNNSLSKIKGYGVFVGGALTEISFVNSSSGLINEQQFEDFFTSTRNKIYNNSTFNNTKDGIKLGLIDWNNYFETSEEQCGGSASPQFRDHQEIPEDSVAIYGNHNQVRPCIYKVNCRRNGNITIDYRLESPEQPFTKFVIQFFVNKTNNIPHGEHYISQFDDPRFEFQTDGNGKASRSVTFVPLAKVNNGDTISAHVTVTTIGQSTSVDDKFKGDTSEFAVESDKNTCPTSIMTRPSTQNSKPGFASILNR